MKDGKGYIKEYGGGKSKFEGEYLYGQRNGKGKEYSYNGKLIFEGEYLNGNKNGKCKEYNNDGELIFEGEYLNGKRKECIIFWKNNNYNLNIKILKILN